jgi:thioredoxin-like negative regulator of GroEL
MISILMSILAAALGFTIAYFLSRAPELRPFRLSQLIFVPLAMVTALNLLPSAHGRYVAGDLQNFIYYVGVAGFVAVLMGPNIAHYCGLALSNFIDPHDWKPSEEEIDLRPVQRLIDREQHGEALTLLDSLLKIHKATFEALLLKTRLLYNFQNVPDTLDTLLKMLPLSKSTAQRVAVMEGLVAIQNQSPRPRQSPNRERRIVRIQHELLVLPLGAKNVAVHADIPPGVYEVEPVFEGPQCWLQLAGETWGNFEMCWDAVQIPDAPPEIAAGPTNPFLAWIASMHRKVGYALAGAPDFQAQAEARKLLKEANHFIRRLQWTQALPLLQKASACDPHCYEVAYRLMEATRRCEDRQNVTRTLRRVLHQSNWSENEQIMLQG